MKVTQDNIVTQFCVSGLLSNGEHKLGLVSHTTLILGYIWASSISNDILIWYVSVTLFDP